MKLVHRVLIPFDGNSVGGSHLSSIEFQQSVASSEFNVILGIHHEGRLSSLLEESLVPFEKLPTVTSDGSLRGLHSLLRDAIRARKYLLSRSVDLVHTQDHKMHVIWSLGALFAGKKHVMHVRINPPPKKSLGFHTALRLSSRIICVSHFVARRISRNTSVVHNPISSFSFRKNLGHTSEFHEAPEINGAAPKVIWVANFVSQKRPELVPEIARKLREENYHDFKMVMVGAPYDQSLVERVWHLIKEFDLSEHVQILGWRPDVLDLIAESHLLIATSQREAYGRTLVEAIISEVPVIATNEGGHPEVLEYGKLGTLVEPNVDEFVRAIKDRIRDRVNKKNDLQTYRKVVETRNSPKSHATKIIEIYKSALEGSG